MRENLRELLCYVLTGGITTAVNYGIFLLLLGMELNYLAANSLAWVGAVLFAFGANRRLVFKSEGVIGKQLIRFTSLRLMTLVLENILLLLLIDVVGIMTMAAKILVSVVTVILNYFACKYHIFREGSVINE